jgi:hypothetical protein
VASALSFSTDTTTAAAGDGSGTAGIASDERQNRRRPAVKTALTHTQISMAFSSNHKTDKGDIFQADWRMKMRTKYNNEVKEQIKPIKI